MRRARAVNGRRGRLRFARHSIRLPGSDSRSVRRRVRPPPACASHQPVSLTTNALSTHSRAAKLYLEVAEFRDSATWLWRLTDDRGVLLAEQPVALDSSAFEYSGYINFYRFLDWHADPTSGPGGQRVLADNVGRWIGEHVLGTVGQAIVARARLQPVTVCVSVPSEAEPLLYHPLELGIVAGKPLALHDVSLVYTLTGEPSFEKQEIGSQLRMLALFCTPSDQPSLDASSERRDLCRLVQRLVRSSGRSIELRVLQYGVTREALSYVLGERDGWDVIHFSGHGLPAGVVFEFADGSADPVSSHELTQLLRPTRSRLKLVTLSSCESATATATRSLRLLGIPQPSEHQAADSDRGEGALPAVARELSCRLGCAALAMRYVVDDDFAISLARNLYEALFRDGQPLPRALQSAISHATSSNGTSASALAAVTPALFGRAAVDLLLEPPHAVAGQEILGDIPRARLAHFPPEPQRFVGRVKGLARASGALAPSSSHRAVLFHGMAGAGKTACALELTYRQDEHRFDALAWYSAPPEGHDTTSALAEFAVTLEMHIEWLELVHAIDDRELLGRLLPQITRTLGERSALIVLDNVESLMSAEGVWRDERWGRVIDALITHSGPSRLVVTSRRIPVSLAGDERVMIEQVNTLSASESVLLARKLPHLGAMIRSGSATDVAAGRKLVKRVLETVQGNPKLMELADRQAVDRDVLVKRLDEVTAAWGEGADRLAASFASKRYNNDHTADDFLHVLATWATSSAAALPTDARFAFDLLCALEERDRVDVVIDGNWAELWQVLRCPGAPPDCRAALAALANHGLVDIRTAQEREGEVYYVHPAIERAGRQATAAEFRVAVSTQMASFWQAMFMSFQDVETSEQTGPLVIHAGLSAAPYLMRLNRRYEAMAILERMVVSDHSARALAAILPYLEQIAERDIDTPNELQSAAVLAQVRAFHQPASSLPRLRELLDRAAREHDKRLACILTSHVINTLVRLNCWEEALRFADSNAGYTKRAGLGPWTQAAEQGRRLEILLGLGRNEVVLAEAGQLLEYMDTLTGDDPESVVPFNIREATLRTARTAAVELGRYETALELSQALRASTSARGASGLEQAQIAASECGPLIRLGRYEDAERVLRACRDVFDAEHYREGLAVVYGTWSDLEDKFNHPEQAIDFGQRALRLDYAIGHIDDVVGAHHNLAHCLARGHRDTAHAMAHRLAAAVIAHHARPSSDAIISPLHALASALSDAGEEMLPASFAELCASIQHRDGVDLARLLASVSSPSAPIWDDILREVLEQARGVQLSQSQVELGDPR
jgi:tetratricopeptide (TPR) repeat protein